MDIFGNSFVQMMKETFEDHTQMVAVNEMIITFIPKVEHMVI